MLMILGMLVNSRWKGPTHQTALDFSLPLPLPSLELVLKDGNGNVHEN